MKKSPIYNLRLSDNHTFFAEGILVHNQDAKQRETERLNNETQEDKPFPNPISSLEELKKRSQRNTDIKIDEAGKLIRPEKPD